jgi:hypothetical protein
LSCDRPFGSAPKRSSAFALVLDFNGLGIAFHVARRRARRIGFPDYATVGLKK